LSLACVAGRWLRARGGGRRASSDGGASRRRRWGGKRTVGGSYEGPKDAALLLRRSGGVQGVGGVGFEDGEGFGCVGAIDSAFSQLYDDSAVVDVGLRWVDYTNHACLAVARVSTIKPDGCCVVNSKGESFWLFLFSIELHRFRDATHIWGSACCN
jgi:hypothetical protein